MSRKGLEAKLYRAVRRRLDAATRVAEMRDALAATRPKPKLKESPRNAGSPGRTGTKGDSRG